MHPPFFSYLLPFLIRDKWAKQNIASNFLSQPYLKNMMQRAVKGWTRFGLEVVMRKRAKALLFPDERDEEMKYGQIKSTNTHKREVLSSACVCARTTEPQRKAKKMADFSPLDCHASGLCVC